MIAENIISNDIIPLKTSDTGEEALETMSEFYIRHLPIVNNEQLLGLLSEDDVLENDANAAVGGYHLSLPLVMVREGDHVYEVMRIMAQYELTLVPVVSSEDKYIGFITLEDMTHRFTQMHSFLEPGCIIVLEIGKRDYSMSEIARIVESENGIILSSFVGLSPDSTKMNVTIKVNLQHIQALIATFHRFDYIVKASFNETAYFNALKDRYNALMAYLNI